MSIKILFLSHKFYPDIGGIEANSEILATVFSESGYKVKILTWTKEKGNKVFPFEVIRSPGIATLFKEHKWADVVFENNPCLRLAWPSLFLNAISVIALRTWISRTDGKTGIQDILKKKWVGRAKAVIAVSESVRKKSWPAAIVIGNPYRINLFQNLGSSVRIKDFVYLGRLVSDKGVELAILAISKLKNLVAEGKLMNANLLLTIIGEGPERQALETLVKELNVDDKVSFTGKLTGDDLVQTLNQHRFLIVPSLWEEPFGNVALEGMACGCVPLVSNGGGLPDAVGRAGVVFERGSVDSIVGAIQMVFQNPDLELSLKNAAAEHLENHHPNVVGKLYLDVIKNAFQQQHK